MANFTPDPREIEADLVALEERNRERLAGWWDLLGVEPHYPTATDVAVRLLRAVEYDVDADWVLAATTNGWIPPVNRQNGRLAWLGTDVVSLAAAAEARRKWQPFSKIHGHKLTMAEKIQQTCEQHGGESFDDIDRFDFDALLAMLVQLSADAGAVQTLAAAIREKLKREGVLS